MKTHSSQSPGRQAYILVLTLVFLGLSVLFLACALSWSSQNTRNTDRGNEYYTSSAAAEAATEKVLIRIDRDYVLSGEGATFNNMPSYRATIPTNTDDPYWGNYTFTAPPNGVAGLAVSRIAPYQFVILSGQYAGLFGNRATYRIAANAQLNGSRYGLKSSVWQDVGVEAIPIFQFAIFYNMDLEIEPGQPMLVTGRVHSNSNIYTMPGSGISLTFSNDVTASGAIYPRSMPGDPSHTPYANPNITYDGNPGQPSASNSTLNLPIGTNNSPSNIYALLQIPPASELNTSPMGTNRFYNKADVIILVSNNSVTVTSGVGVDNRATIITNAGPAAWTNFLTTNATFYNGREQKTILTTEFDVGKFRAWAEPSTNVLKGRMMNKTTADIVYIADMRTPPAGDEVGVRLVNGSQLPNNGLTVASPDPVYIKGDYNTTTNGINYSTNVNTTAYTYPASVLGDAITILSKAWNDANPNNSTAATTTINAAFLSGIVPTTTNSYSGGVENFPRFLENWGNGVTFWYNGSMVVMFNSEIDKGLWNTGGYYTPPTRRWAFDTNFYDESKLPPGTPQILIMERLHWAIMPPNADPGDTSTFSPTNYAAWPIL